MVRGRAALPDLVVSEVRGVLRVELVRLLLDAETLLVFRV